MNTKTAGVFKTIDAEIKNLNKGHSMTSFEQGFIEKCAQHNKEPLALIKNAVEEGSLDSRALDYLAALVPVVGHGFLGASRYAAGDSDSPRYSMSGTLASLLGGGVAGGASGYGLSTLINAMTKGKANLNPKSLMGAGALLGGYVGTAEGGRYATT